MTVETVSEINVPGIGKVKHTQEMTFPDYSNVFGRVYDYRHEMNRLFPGCEYRLIKAKQKEGNRK